MPVKLAPHQLAFWREILAPFPDHQLSTTTRAGKTLTYIDKRALTNRLDSVLGPHGWYPEYEPTARGYKCRLFLLVPLATEGTEVWMHKEDGAGFEEMGSVNKATHEFEYDVDNDEKSGYTNAFRRAAQDAWGIGRYLYNKGIPTFLDPNANASPAPALPPINSYPNPSAPPAELSDRQAPPPSTRDKPAQPSGADPNGQRQFDNFKIPRPGKSVFAWCKEMEKAFETTLVGGMGSAGEKQGWGKLFGEWNEVQVNTVCLGVIKFLRELPSYKGQFEYLFPGGAPDAAIPTATGSGPNTPPTTPGINVADLRRKLIASMQALLLKQTGVAPDTAKLKAAFNAIASASKNEHGNLGEIPESLAGLTDAVWVSNMIGLVEQQMAAPAGSNGPDDDIPF